MIMRFLDWSHDQEQPFGILAFCLVGTFMCCTGLVFLVLAYDMLNEKDD